MLYKSRNQFLPFFPKRKINLTCQHHPFQYQKRETYPKPKHHLHKPIRKNHPILQLIQPLPRLPPSHRLTLINKKRHGEKQTKPRRRQQRPDLRVQCRQTRDEGVSAHRAGDGHRGLVAGCFCGGDDFVDLGDFRDEDEVDEGVGYEEDAAEGEGGLGAGEAGCCVLFLLVILRVYTNLN